MLKDPEADPSSGTVHFAGPQLVEFTHKNTSPGYDRFVLSPAQYALVLYAVLIETGRMDEAGMRDYNRDGSSVEMMAHSWSNLLIKIPHFICNPPLAVVRLDQTEGGNAVCLPLPAAIPF